MKNYTHEEVQQLIKSAINATMYGTVDWIKKHTVIIDVNGNELPDAIIDIKKFTQDSKLYDEVCKRLKEEGIEVLTTQTNTNE